MEEQAVHYTKLPGPGAGWAGRTRLWLAEDHVLEVNSSIFTERYHRYFLQDIRSVVAQRTKTGLYWNIALGSLAFLGLAVGGGFFWGGTTLTNDEGRIALWVFSGMFAFVALVFIIALIANIFLGPTCRFYIQTTAGTRLIAAPTRIRRAQRLLTALIPHVEAVQSAEIPAVPS